MKVAIIGRSGHMGRIHETTAREWGAEIVDCAVCADIVVIASPDNTHVSYIKEHDDRPIFCEKPLATTMEDLDDIVDQSYRNPIGCHLPLRQFANEFEIEGTTVDLVYDYGRKTKFLNSWRNSPDYDLVMGGGIHLMDLWMLKTGIRQIDVGLTARIKLSSEAKCPDWFIGEFWTGLYNGLLRVNFTKDGSHRHVVSWATGRTTDRKVDRWINEKPTDKTYQLRAFLDKPQTDHLALASHRACLQFRENTGIVGRDI